jgi:hypothetical protein
MSSLTGPRTLDPHLDPHRHEQKFPGARFCRVTVKHPPPPQPLRSHIQSFRTTFENTPPPPFLIMQNMESYDNF